MKGVTTVSILVLVEGILQFPDNEDIELDIVVSILVLVEGILQYIKAQVIVEGANVSILVLVEGTLQPAILKTSH